MNPTNLQKPLRIKGAYHLNSKYFNTSGVPYTNTAQVLSQIATDERVIYETVNVAGAEYWFYPDINTLANKFGSITGSMVYPGSTGIPWVASGAWGTTLTLGAGLSIVLGALTASATSYTLPAATTSTLGGVIIGSGLSIVSGVLSAPGLSVADGSALSADQYILISSVISGALAAKAATGLTYNPVSGSMAVPGALSAGSVTSIGAVNLKNGSGVLQWSLSVDGTNNLVVKNSAGTIKATVDQSGNLKVAGNVYFNVTSF